MITLLVGTNRPGNNSRKIARHLEEIYAELEVCFTGVAAGIRGALRPIEQLQAIFGYRNAFIYPERVFIPQVHSVLDENGRLKNAELLERLRKQAEGFVDFTEKLKQVKLRGTSK
jgi:NAD(P)H-dependent FMN reductase